MTDFEWPWEYTFPPFFTLQLHAETRKQQINVWADIFLKYLQHINKYSISINDNELPIFYNKSLNRRLSQETILLILEQLERTGYANRLEKSSIEWIVYPYTLEEYGRKLYDWIQQTGQINSVCTLLELISDDSNVVDSFNGLDERVLRKVLEHMQSKGHCEIIEMNDSYGVKFF